MSPLKPGFQSPHCARCGARLDSAWPEGNCAACLLELSLSLSSQDLPTDSTPPHSSSKTQPSLDRSGDYEIIREIARGGMGIVYLAHHRGLRRDVAFKRIAAGPLASTEDIQRFYSEGRTLSRLSHPHIVSVYDVGEDDRGPFLTMAWMPGGTLEQRLQQQPAPTLEQRVEWMIQIAEAVQHAHERGVLHRDLKPSNILFDDQDQPRVADFGLAKVLEQDAGLTRSQGMVGTPAYMAPEVISQGSTQMTTSAEVYALGALLYELSAGRPPFQAASIPALLQKIEQGQPRSIVSTLLAQPRKASALQCIDLELICLKALQRNPNSRYDSAQALAQELNRWLRQEPIQARPPRLPERLLAWRRRHPGLAASILAASFAITLGLAATAWQWQRAEKLRRWSEANTYAADLRIASQSLLEGNLGRASALLTLHRPTPDTEPDFAWRWLSQSARGDHLTKAGEHDWIVNAVAWSPDSRSLVSASVGSGTIADDTRLWRLNEASVTTQAMVLQWKGTKAPGGRSVAWMPDGKSFWVAHVDKVSRWWDATSGTVRTEWPGTTLSLATNGLRIATCLASGFPWAEFPASEAIVRTIPEGRELLKVPGARNIALSPDGSWLASSDGNQSLKIHSVETRSLILEQPSKGQVWGITWSPDNRFLAVTGWDSRVRVWDVSNGTSRDFEGHSLPTWKTAFSNDGKLLFSSSSDQTLITWDVATGKKVRSWRGHSGEVWCVAASPDGSRLASGGKDGAVLLWSLQSPPSSPSLKQFEPHFQIRTLQAQNQTWILGLGPRPEFHTILMNASSTNRASLASMGDWGVPIGGLPNGHLLTGGWQFRVQERSLPEGQILQEIQLAQPPDSSTPDSWSLSPDGRILAASRARGPVQLWELPSGRSLPSRGHSEIHAFRTTLSPNHRWLAVTALEEGIWLFDLQGPPSQSIQLKDHKDMAKSARFSPDGRWLATCSVDATVRLIPMGDQGPILDQAQTLIGHKTSVEDIAFTPDNRILASLEAAEGVRLWDVATRREVAEIRIPNGRNHLVFTADGLGLMVSSETGWQWLRVERDRH